MKEPSFSLPTFSITSHRFFWFLSSTTRLSRPSWLTRLPSRLRPRKWTLTALDLLEKTTKRVLKSRLPRWPSPMFFFGLQSGLLMLPSQLCQLLDINLLSHHCFHSSQVSWVINFLEYFYQYCQNLIISWLTTLW